MGDGADLGLPLAFGMLTCLLTYDLANVVTGFAGLVFPPLRWLELKYIGR